MLSKIHINALLFTVINFFDIGYFTKGYALSHFNPTILLRKMRYQTIK